MYDFLMWLGHAYTFTRAFEDSGGFFFRMNVEQRQEYLEAFLLSKGAIS